MKRNLRWAFKVLVLSIFLSIFFSMISQSFFPNLHASLSIFIILFFVAMSVIFDMLGVAVTSANDGEFEKFRGKTGHKSAIWLCHNTEKVSSFCGDVVGDICGILSGAGGVSLVVNLSLSEPNLEFLVTCITSSLIAGITIFGKAVLKGYAVKNHVKVVLLTGKILESSPKTIVLRLKNRIFKRKKDGKAKIQSVQTHALIVRDKRKKRHKKLVNFDSKEKKSQKK